jgi:hypothetical protein
VVTACCCCRVVTERTVFAMPENIIGVKLQGATASLGLVHACCCRHAVPGAHAVMRPACARLRARFCAHMRHAMFFHPAPGPLKPRPLAGRRIRMARSTSGVTSNRPIPRPHRHPRGVGRGSALAGRRHALLPECGAATPLGRPAGSTRARRRRGCARMRRRSRRGRRRRGRRWRR